MVPEEGESGELTVHLRTVGLDDVLEGIELEAVEDEVKHVLFRRELENLSGAPCHFPRPSGSACAAVNASSTTCSAIRMRLANTAVTNSVRAKISPTNGTPSHSASS